MYDLQKSERTRRNSHNPQMSSSLPSFSSSLLDEIYRKTDSGSENIGGEMRFYKEAKQSSYGVGLKTKPKASSSVEDEDTARLRRASLVDKWMEKKAREKMSVRLRQSMPEIDRKTEQSRYGHPYFSTSSNSSDTSSGGLSSSDLEFLGVAAKTQTSCFTSSRPKPVRTIVSAPPEKSGKNSYYEQRLQSEYCFYENQMNPEQPKFETNMIKSKSRALKIYSNLKKVKQPISPGGKLSNFLNSLFKAKNFNAPSSIEEAYTERKAKSAQTSTCSSASSYYRSCLTAKTSIVPKGLPNNGEKRTVRFYPVSVIVDEENRPCGQKFIYREEPRKTEATAAAAMDLPKQSMTEDEDDDDAMSDASSDLFELEHLDFIGGRNSNCNNRRYSEDLPVYETTHLGMNRAIASGLIR